MLIRLGAIEKLVDNTVKRLDETIRILDDMNRCKFEHRIVWPDNLLITRTSTLYTVTEGEMKFEINHTSLQFQLFSCNFGAAMRACLNEIFDKRADLDLLVYDKSPNTELYWPVSKETADYNYSFCLMVAKMIMELVNQCLVENKNVALIRHLTTQENLKNQIRSLMGYYNTWKNDRRKELKKKLAPLKDRTYNYDILKDSRTNIINTSSTSSNLNETASSNFLIQEDSEIDTESEE